ncbi:MAG: hypothetical protein KGI41_04205 [Patescibacteria group bacterium]|nr:hypothetical protein [Patescibacteria group bacterium]MDE1966413.1 hypothetical protein [Patescibacteria group bacterium]
MTEEFVFTNELIAGSVTLRGDAKAVISTVAYEHPDGMPARFAAGLIPAFVLARQLRERGIFTIVRIIDPTRVANYCNGWQMGSDKLDQVVGELAAMLEDRISTTESCMPLTGTSIRLLRSLANELEEADGAVGEMLERLRCSGRRHGGENGARNVALYAAAHPFSWLDLLHDSLWRGRSYEAYQHINLMSKPESRFSVMRAYLRDRHPEIASKAPRIDLEMKVCNTPCYLRLDDEPTFDDFMRDGYDTTLETYYALRTRSQNHRRAYNDFKVLSRY